MTIAATQAFKARLQKVPWLRRPLTAVWNTPVLRRAWLAAQRWRTEPLCLIDDLKREAHERGWRYVAVAGDVVQVSRPSLTIPEEIVDLFNHAGKISTQHARAGEEGPARMYRLWFGQLLSVFRYPVYETFTCEIPDAIISVPNGEVLSSDLRAYTQSTRLEWDTVILDRVPSSESKIDGTVVSLMGWSGDDYGHWLIDILPRVVLVWDQRHEYRFVVPGRLPSFKLESLELLGIRREQLVPLKDGWYRAERVQVCHHAQRYTIPKRVHMLALRDHLHEAVFPDGLPTPSRRVYVSRNKSRRRIVNEDEIMPVLRDFGFERHYCEELAFRDQVKLFAETKYLIGAHGAGLNNDVLCQSGATLIELLNPLRWNYCIRGVANTMGHTHWFLSGRNVSRDWDMTVDPKRLAKLLCAVFEKPDALETEY